MSFWRSWFPSWSSCLQLRVAGTPCRESMDSCDLPEYCNGRDGSCPEDYYLMDGLQCQDAYCHEGRCQTYDFQCRKLFAQGAQANVLEFVPDAATLISFHSICYWRSRQWRSFELFCVCFLSRSCKEGRWCLLPTRKHTRKPVWELRHQQQRRPD